MKKTIGLFLVLASVVYAATDAYYRHHQRTTTATLETDLVAREIGIDASTKSRLIAKKADGTFIHLISKEMDTASLDGVFLASSTARISGAVTLSNYNSGRVPYFTTGGLITDASTFTYNGTTLAVNNGTYSGTLAITGAVTHSSTLLQTGAATFTAAPILSSTTATRLLSTDGSKAAASVADLTTWIGGTSNQITSTSDGDGTLTLSLPSAVTLPGSLSVPGGITIGTNGVASSLSINGAGNESRPIYWNSAGVTRWGAQSTATSEAWALNAYNASGVFIDAPINVVNTASGAMTLARPVTLSATLTAAAATFSSTLGVTGAATFTAAPIFSSATASLPMFTDGSKGLVSNAMTGTGSVMMSASPTTTGTLTGAAANFSGAVSTGALSATTGTFSSTLGVTGASTLAAATLSGNLTLSTLSSGRIPVISTAGLVAQDDFYWDATNDRVGIGTNASTPGAPIHVSGANSASAEVIRLQTGQTTGAAGDYMYILARHRSSGTANVDGATIRFTAEDPETGVRDGKIGLYGSNNEVQTLGLEVSSGGVTTFPNAPIFSSVTASQFLLVDGSKALTSVAGTGTGSVVRATSPTITTPTFSGTIASGLTASRTIVTDGSGNFAVNTETGTGSHMRAGSPTTTGTLTADAVTASGVATLSNLAGAGDRMVVANASGVLSTQTIPTGTTLANPTGTIGLTAVNGVATTGMRSDGAPALSQAIVPTWSGIHTFTLAPVFSSVTASEFLLVNGSKALTSVAGTGTGSVVRATSPTLVTPVLGVAAATSISLGAEAFTYDEGTFTATLTGVTTTVTTTARYVRFGKSVTLYMNAISGTSNTTACTITGMDATIIPARDQAVPLPTVRDNGVFYAGSAYILSAGVINLAFRAAATGPMSDIFTNSGTKGVGDNSTITYTLQ